VVAIDGLAVGGWLDRIYLSRWPALRDTVTSCDLPIKVNLLRVTRFRPVEDRTWRSRPVAATELVGLLRHVVTACFLVTAYLSGVRTGEALNLRRGCITRDHELGRTVMSGQQMKARPPRQERSLRTIPWVVTEQVAHAVSVLEDLATGQMLFPLGEVCSPEWIDPSIRSSRRSGAVNDDITAFITWFNTDIAPSIGHAPIGDDPDGRITAPRLRHPGLAHRAPPAWPRPRRDPVRPPARPDDPRLRQGGPQCAGRAGPSVAARCAVRRLRGAARRCS